MPVVLKLIFGVCVAAPLLAAAWRPSRTASAAAAGGAVLLVLAILAGVLADPLAVALLRVDGGLSGGVCSSGLRPLR